jgi:hypothetical protein
MQYLPFAEEKHKRLFPHFQAQKKTHSERNHKTLGEELLTMTTST